MDWPRVQSDIWPSPNGCWRTPLEERYYGFSWEHWHWLVHVRSVMRYAMFFGVQCRFQILDCFLLINEILSEELTPEPRSKSKYGWSNERSIADFKIVALLINALLIFSSNRLFKLDVSSATVPISTRSLDLGEASGINDDFFGNDKTTSRCNITRKTFVVWYSLKYRYRSAACYTCGSSSNKILWDMCSPLSRTWINSGVEYNRTSIKWTSRWLTMLFGWNWSMSCASVDTSRRWEYQKRSSAWSNPVECWIYIIEFDRNAHHIAESERWKKKIFDRRAPLSEAR